MRLVPVDPAPTDDATTPHLPRPVDAERQAVDGKGCGAEVVHDQLAIRCEQASAIRQRPNRLLGAVEVREHARHHDEGESLRPPDRADVGDVELQASGRTRLTEEVVRRDPILGSREQGRRAVDADERARAALEERPEQPPGAAPEIEDGRRLTSRPVAVEAEVLDDLVVLEIIELGQDRLVGGLSGEDVAQWPPPGRPRPLPPPCRRSSSQARSTRVGSRTRSMAVAARTSIAFGRTASPSAPPAWSAKT